MDKGILKDGKVIPVDNLIEWEKGFETTDRRVERTILSKRKHIFVSTVFLGLNHAFFPDSPPQWFETMVFGTSISGHMDRYPDIESARRGHGKWVGIARQARQTRGENAQKSLKRTLKSFKKLRLPKAF